MCFKISWEGGFHCTPYLRGLDLMGFSLAIPALPRFAFAVKWRIIPPSIARFERSEFGDGMMLVCKRVKDIFKLLCISTRGDGDNGSGPGSLFYRYMMSCFSRRPEFEPVRVSVEGKVDGKYTDETMVKVYHSFLQPEHDLSHYVGLVMSKSKRRALELAQRREQRRGQRRR
jgi:hypothetical protein